MSWVDKRIEEYKKGNGPTWIEKRILEHAHPAHLVMVVAGFIALVYGLWINDWFWIIYGLIFNILGHIYTWLE